MSTHARIAHTIPRYVAPAGGTGYNGAVLADSPLVYYRLGESFSSGVTTTASSTNFPTEPPANAFDADPTTNWTTSSGNVAGWLRAQMASSVALTAYRIKRRDDLPNRNPKTWTFEGSNDASTWTTLDTQTNITWPTSGETKSFTFSNTTSYLYYRLNITANNGDASFTSVNDLFLMPAAADASGHGRNQEYQGLVAGNATGLITGDSDKAVTFSGGAVPLPYASSWMDLSTIALEAVIKSSTTGAFQIIVNRDSGGGTTRSFQFRINSSNKVELVMWTSAAGPFTITGATSLSANTKYHVGASFDGTTARVFLNGASDGSSSVSGNLYGNTGTGSLPMMIGRLGGSSQAFAGVIDEVAIYSSLSSTRFAAHAALV